MFLDFQKKIRIDRKTAAAPHVTVVGFPHYFPLSFLPQDFWDDMALNPAFRVTDGKWNELPIQVIDLDVENQTGSLWIKHDKAATKQAFWIHWDSETVTTFDSASALAVWTSFRDVIHLNEGVTDGPEPSLALNSARNETGEILSNSLNFQAIDSALEQKAFYFTNELGDNVIQFTGGDTLDKWSSPVTFIFLMKFIGEDHGLGTHLLVNYNKFLNTFKAFDITTGWADGYGAWIGFTLGNDNLPLIEIYTADNVMEDVVPEVWNLFAIKFEAGADGVEVDVNSIARAMAPGSAVPVYPPDNDWTDRFVGLHGNQFLNTSLSAVMIYEGGLEKAQRDQFYVNWITPGQFWDVVGSSSKKVCLKSPMQKKLCFSSHIKK